MIDAITHILTSIFDYLFAQNAPMTILLMIVVGSALWYVHQRERRILAPMEQSKNSSELLKLQMTYIDDSMDELHPYLYGLYRHARKLGLETLGDADPRGSLESDWQTFLHSVQLWGVLAIVKNEIRKYLRDNHLSDKNDDEFQIYLDLRLKNVWAQFILAVNQYWFSGMDHPNRSDMFDVHEENKENILRIIREMMIESRRIAIKFRAMKEKAKKTNIKNLMA